MRGWASLRIKIATQLQDCLFVKLAGPGFAHSHAPAYFLEAQVFEIVQRQYFTMPGLEPVDVRAKQPEIFLFAVCLKWVFTNGRNLAYLVRHIGIAVLCFEEGLPAGFEAAKSAFIFLQTQTHGLGNLRTGGIFSSLSRQLRSRLFDLARIPAVLAGTGVPSPQLIQNRSCNSRTGIGGKLYSS